MNGGEALVETLIANGVETAFCVPGESYLSVLDGLCTHQNQVRLIVNRHESGATFAACAHARLTRKPGIVFVTRGPGATNGSIGLHTARQDSVPLVCFIGQVPRDQLGREAFQEIDYAKMFAPPMTKGVFEPMTGDAVAKATSDALALALAGRPGPTVVVLPEDVTSEEAGSTLPAPVSRAEIAPVQSQIDAAIELIEGAQRPVIIAGEMVSFDGANDALAAFADAIGAGVFSAFRQQGVIPCSHAAYLGPIGLALPPYQAKAMDEADLVIAIGNRLDAATTADYIIPREGQTLIHQYPDADVLAKSGAQAAIRADSGPALAALLANLTTPPADRFDWRATQRAAFEAFMAASAPTLGAVDMAEVIRTLAEKLPDDATISNDAGNFATWLHRYYPYQGPATQVGPMAGAMGYAVPGALGAQLARPDKRVVALCGDGGFGMTGQELATAVAFGLPIIVIVCDNAFYGTIAMHQYRRYGADRLHGSTTNRSPDFAGIAKATGAAAWTVERTEQFGPALDGALKQSGPALIHIKTDIRDLAASGLKLEQ